jgi:hypothetical protein
MFNRGRSHCHEAVDLVGYLPAAASQAAASGKKRILAPGSAG